MAYTNSPLVAYTKLSPNKNSPRTHAIDTITIHHMAGNLSVERCGDLFAAASRQASSNYGIGSDGRIALYVEEKDRSWCSSSKANDHRAVTIEVANDGTAGTGWHVSDKALAALVALVIDICRRNNIKKLVWSDNKTDRINHKNGCNMTVHRDFAATSCPGDYLYRKQAYIAAEVNKSLMAPVTNQGPEAADASVQHKVGDIVNFVGGKQYTSANAVSGSTAKAGPAKITVISSGAKHPYHVIHTDSTSNVYGWVDAADISTSAAAGNTYTTYTAKSGDSLWSIAAKQLGNGDRYKEIKALNNLSSDVIHAGQVLELPS